MKPLVIVGAGGLGREIAALVRDINAQRATWELAGFIDDDPAAAGRTVDDLEVLGGQEWLAERSGTHDVAFGVGSPAVRFRLLRALRPHAAAFPALVHPTVVRTPYLELGEGALVTAGNILTSQITVGAFALLNLACTVGHDARIGDFVTVAPGVAISGHVVLEEGCDIGTGSSLVQGTRVGAWSVVGAGAVVARDIPANVTAVGVPARPIKERPPGWHEAA